MQRNFGIDFVNRVRATSMVLEAVCSKTMTGVRKMTVRVRGRSCCTEDSWHRFVNGVRATSTAWELSARNR